MNKHLHNSLRALCLSLAVLLSLPMLAVEIEINGINYYLDTETYQATVIAKSSGTYYSGKIVIPESVEHEGVAYSVTRIGTLAFEVSDLTSVTIPNSVTSIGISAFSGCFGLTSVTIPNSVTSIESRAFYGCSGLTSVTIGNSVTSIDDEAFCSCSGLTSVTIPNSVTSIGGRAFSGCSDLTSVTIPNSVTSIGISAFSGCSGLTSVTIPNSVTSIGDWAFGECSGLTSVAIPNSVTGIGEGAFAYCSGLTSIVVEDGNSVYDSRNNCNAIIETATNTLHSGCKTTIIPNSVTSIGDRAFSGCSGLTSVTIPNSVTSIGDRAFYDCSGLTSVAIGNSVTSIGEAAFKNTAWWEEQSNGLVYWDSWLMGYKGDEPTGEISIKQGTKGIAGSAFAYCSGLTSVAIPNSVTSIGTYAFEGCSALTSVTIPNSVTSIGDRVFSGCSGLTSVAIPNSVTSIGRDAFYHCSGLTSVAIGNSVTNIGSWAFSYCSKLHDIYCYAEDVPATNSKAFYDSPIASATLHVPNASIDSYKATEPWSGFGNIVGLSNEFNLTVSSAGYATLFLDFNAEIPAAVQAYTGVKVVGNRLKMERVEGVLPANTGVIIKAKEGTYTFAESDATPATIGDNLLYGTVATTQISTDPTYSYYVLSKVDGIVGMYLAKLTDGKFQNNANKAYMMLKKGDLGIYDEGVDTGTEQLSRGFVFDFGEETSIDELKSEDGKVKSAVYDLSGRRVQKAQKGVYIQNGKVVLVR